METKHPINCECAECQALAVKKIMDKDGEVWANVCAKHARQFNKAMR